MDQIRLFPVSTEFRPDGNIFIAGIGLDKLTHEYGTPLYLYDGKTVGENFNRLENCLKNNYPGRSQVAYASKAYLSLSFAGKLAALGASIDVVSLSELEIALQAGFDPGKIHLHGNNKSEGELKFAIEKQIAAIVIDSLEEFQFVESICRKMGRSQTIWLRINPDIAVDTHKAIQTGHGASKFGIPSQNGEALQAIRLAQSSECLQLKGIHVHLGSQLFDAGVYSTVVTSLLELCRKADFHPEVISPGGGWGVPYTESDPEIDPEEWIKHLSEALLTWCEMEGKPLPELVIEPGRWLAARAGVALYKVGTTKQVQEGEWIAAIDGGMADNPRHALYGAKYTARLVGSADGRPEVNTRLVGRFCESGDELIHCIPLPKLQRGELVAMPVCGAYQLSMASNYNLADRPCVLWLEDGRVEVMQPREHASRAGWWAGS